MRSLRSRLFVILAVATGLVWAFAAGWIWISTRAEVERVLDARLMEAARMVSSLIETSEIGTAVASLDRGPAPMSDAHTPYERQITCQIWSLNGSLLGRSDGAPASRLSDHAAGFAERQVDGETWRVFTVRNEALGVEVLVGDNPEIRRKIVRDMLTGLAVPMGLGLPILAVFLWLGAGRGLRPLQSLADGLEVRSADDLDPIREEGTAGEIRPVVTALNGLFARVQDSREHERQFLSYAAHELRTPLAGLKTQAEIAAKAPDEDMRRAALARVGEAVDRSSRLVRQLLALGEAEAGGTAALAPTDVGALLEPLLTDQAERLAAKGGELVLDSSLADFHEPVHPSLLSLAMRNLVENAVAHSPEGRTVRVFADGASLAVEDEGPGMADDDLARAADRFFRGPTKPASAAAWACRLLTLRRARWGHGCRFRAGCPEVCVRRWTSGTIFPATAGQCRGSVSS
jgi:two-component system sensor histidine kinase QseC